MQDSVIALWLLVVFTGITGSIVLAYPLLLLIRSAFFPCRALQKSPVMDNAAPSLSFIVVIRNAELLIVEKINNLLALDYPQNSFEIIVFSDGSSDQTVTLAKTAEDPRIRVFESKEHIGKNQALNRAIDQATGEIVIFSDGDSLIESSSLRALLMPFADARTGGVCGKRVIQEKETKLSNAQQTYIAFDSWLKIRESECGSITSSEGKLSAVRRELLQTVAEGVTDDSYIAFCIIRQGYRFVFEPEARAFIHLPSRSALHEIDRRRRVVASSLRGIWLSRSLLNPLRFPFYSMGLLFNKIGRRFLPLLLIGIFICTLVLAQHSLLMQFILADELVFVFLPLLIFPVLPRKFRNTLIGKIIGKLYYIIMGMIGTLLGTLDFLRGKTVTKWEPRKAA